MYGSWIHLWSPCSLLNLSDNCKRWRLNNLQSRCKELEKLLKKWPLTFPAILWFVKVLDTKPRKKKINLISCKRYNDNTVKFVLDNHSWDHSKVVVLERWSSYKKTCIKQPLTKFGHSWQGLVFSPSVKVL